MTWNEPGGDKGDKDPWSGKGKGGGNQGPPDLDEVVKKLQEKLGGLFGGGGSSSNGSGSGKGMPPGGAGAIAVVVLAGIALILVANSFYKIEAAERGVRTAFWCLLSGYRSWFEF